MLILSQVKRLPIAKNPFLCYFYPMDNAKIELQHKKGKLFVTERLDLLLDKGSFTEILDGDRDGVYTGCGLINGEKVFVFAQDFTEQGGSIGLRHGKRIAEVISRAIDEKRPVIGIFDSGGARITEGVDALAGCGEFLYQNVRASGVIPQISVILGPTAGASSYSQSISDVVFSVKNVGCSFVTGPDVVRSVTGEECTPNDLGGAEMHAEESGLVHVLCDTEETCFASIRKFFSLLLNKQIPHFTDHGRSFLSDVEKLDQKTPYDMRNVIADIFDKDSFFELQPLYAPNLTVGLALLGNVTVGVIADNPKFLGGALDVRSAEKGGRFVRFCDCFNIPVITLTDTPGYLPGTEQEHGGIVRRGAKLLYAYAEATVPKITLIVRKAYGGAYIAMGSKHLRADKVYALSSCRAAVMGAEGATNILYRKQLAALGDSEKKAFLNQKTEEFIEKQSDVNALVEKGYVDEILPADKVRSVLYRDVVALSGRSRENKHGNIPL